MNAHIARPAPRSPRAAVAAGAALVLAAALGPSGVQAQGLDGDDPSPHSELSLVAEAISIRPGEPFTVALRFTLDPHWHTYWVNGGDAGLPLEVQWRLPPGFTAGPLEWPAPERIPAPPLMSYGFEDELVVLVEITPPTRLERDATVELAAAADWLVCEEICLPAKGDVTLTLPVVDAPPSPDERWAALVETARGRLPRRPEGWRTTAWSTGEGYVLDLHLAPGDALAAPYFFVDQIGIVEHASAQRVVRAEGEVRMLLPRSEFASDDPPVLRGVLAGDAGADGGRAWAIEVPLGPAPADAPTDAFFAAGVQQTGGVGAPAVEAALARGAVPAMGFWIALLFALLGGLALNLMPCVFPVLAVKVLGFVQQSGADPRAARRHGLAFGSGVLVSLWTLAAALLGLRAAGAGLGWGFQLQSPAVVALLTLIVFALALNLAGVFEIGLGLTRLGGVGGGGGYRGSFLTGGLAVLVATPCTAPFMGAALGYALVQPWWVGLSVFTALGVGLAAPYMLLSSAPGLLRRLPRPGPWMVTFKEVLAFPMFATAVWLLWVFGRQLGIDAVAVLLLSLTLMGFSAWIAGRPSAFTRPSIRRAAAAVAGVAVLVGLAAAHPGSGTPVAAADLSVEWEAFSPARLTELRATGRPVFVDFNAAWCISCQVNDRVSLSSAAVRRAFAEADVALVRADWTSRDPVIGEALGSFGRSGVPLYVLYPADGGDPEILPALLSPGLVVSAVGRSAAARKTAEL